MFLLLAGQAGFANMASPTQEGTHAAAAFTSRDVDIVKEKISIRIDKDFKRAAFVIEYWIKTDTTGQQIPLLFHAVDYQGDFKVWVDNQLVPLLDIPGEYLQTANSPFEKFSDWFTPPSREGDAETVVIYWTEGSGIVYELRDLKYFETDLSKGEHRIRVEYTAEVWTDISAWVKEYSFRYSLSPAKNWKSFGSLEILLDATALHAPISTNLGSPAKGRLDSMAVWTFSKLPAENLEIRFVPEISSLAKALIGIGPTGITLLISALLILLHIFEMARFRKRNPDKKYSWVVIAGSILIPFLALLPYPYSFKLIDGVIGAEAGRYHGYSFLVIFLYPLLFPVYWLIMWLIDKMIKNSKLHGAH